MVFLFWDLLPPQDPATPMPVLPSPKQWAPGPLIPASSIFLPLTLFIERLHCKPPLLMVKIRKPQVCNGKHGLSSVGLTPANNERIMSPPKEASSLSPSSSSPSPSLPSSSSADVSRNALDGSSPPQVSALRALLRCEEGELPVLPMSTLSSGFLASLGHPKCKARARDALPRVHPRPSSPVPFMTVCPPPLQPPEGTITPSLSRFYGAWNLGWTAGCGVARTDALP